MVRPSVGMLRTVMEWPPVCPELKISEPPNVLPTVSKYAVALPELHVKMAVDDGNGQLESGLSIWPYGLADGGGTAAGGVGPPVRGCNKVATLGTPRPVQRS